MQSPKYTPKATLVTTTPTLITSKQFSRYTFVNFLAAITINPPATTSTPTMTIITKSQCATIAIVSFGILSPTCANTFPPSTIHLPALQIQFHTVSTNMSKSSKNTSERIATNIVVTIAYHHKTTSIASNPIVFALYCFSSPFL